MSHLWRAQHGRHLSAGGSFLNPEGGGSQQEQAGRGDLGPLPSLDPDLEYFLGEHTSLQGAEERRSLQQDLQPEPPPEDYCKWIEWYGQYVDMPTWWQELQVIPNVEDHQELAWKVRTSFEVPMAWIQAQGGENEYSVLPDPKCIGKDRFLPPLDPWIGNQEYHLGQPRKTLAYAKALQYWVEREKPSIPSKPHQLMKSILELRWAMEPFTTFEDSEVLSDDITPQDIDVCHSHQANPRGSFSVVYSGRWRGPSVSHIAQDFMPATP